MLIAKAYTFSSKEPQNFLERFDLGHTKIFKRSDGIIEVLCADSVVYDIPHIIENHNCMQKLANGGKVIKLTLAGKDTSITVELRDYLAFGYHHTFIAAECFLIDSLAQRIIANFYFKVHKPKVPMQYFSFKDRALAEEWLNNYKSKV